MKWKKPLGWATLVLLGITVLITQMDYRKLAYKHGDWLIKRKVLEVFKLYGPQQDELKVALNSYMLWHKKVMLPNYLAFLNKVDDRIRQMELDDKNFSPEEMDLFLKEMKSLYNDTLIELGHKISPILSHLNETQIDRSRTLLDRRLESIRNLKEIKKETLIQELNYSWRGNFESLLGVLNNDQLDILNKTIFRIYQPPHFQLAYEGKINQMILDTLDSKEKKWDQFKDFWIQHTDQELWRIELSKLFTKMINLSQHEQLDFLRKRLKDWRELLEVLKS